jgi:hypothetical protein
MIYNWLVEVLLNGYRDRYYQRSRCPAGKHIHRLLTVDADPNRVAHEADGPEQILLDHAAVGAPDALIWRDPVQDKKVLDWDLISRFESSDAINTTADGLPLSSFRPLNKASRSGLDIFRMGWASHLIRHSSPQTRC